MTDFWINYFFPFLTIIGLLFLYFTLRNLLPSFFNEKGKNLATKQDISEITRLVEGVKHSFTKETEKLKANLQLLTNVQAGLASEERNAIVDYNEKYFRWLNMLCDPHFGNIDDSDNNDLDNYRTRIRDSYTTLLNSETKFKLFVENPDLIKYSDKMKLETLKGLARFAPNFTLSMKHNNIDIEIMRKKTPIEEQTDKYADLLKKKSVIYEEYNNGMLNALKEIVPLNYAFQKMCRDHIYQLLQKHDKK